MLRKLWPHILRALPWKQKPRQEVVILGSCRQCGACCRRISLQTTKGWIRSREEFARLLRKHPDYSRFRISGRDEQGYLLFTCSWLQEDGSCADHDNRLPICRGYPDPRLPMEGGELLPGCGYYILRGKPFSRYLDQARKRYPELPPQSRKRLNIKG